MKKFRLSRDYIIRFMVLSFMFISCSNQEPEKGSSRSFKYPEAGVEKSSDIAPRLPYDLASPSVRYTLPGSLAEISGISYYRPNRIACIQDERGLIYIYDLKKEKIFSKHLFGKSGDYEDIAVVGDTAYVLRSDGVILKVEDFTSNGRNVKKISTPLSTRNDAEGLVFDSATHALWIACKGSSSLNPDANNNGYKAVFRFDLSGEKLSDDPLFLVDLARLPDMEKSSWIRKLSVRLGKALKILGEDWNFQPSGIAIHPVEDDIYIISHIGKLLVVLDRNGKIGSVNRLDPKTFRQPEGICFTPEGDLFISNEGDGGKGNILKFNYIPR